MNAFQVAQNVLEEEVERLVETQSRLSAAASRSQQAKNLSPGQNSELPQSLMFFICGFSELFNGFRLF